MVSVLPIRRVILGVIRVIGSAITAGERWRRRVRVPSKIGGTSGGRRRRRGVGIRIRIRGRVLKLRVLVVIVRIVISLLHR